MACESKTQFIVLLTFSLLSFSLSRQIPPHLEPDTNPSECANRRIHIRRLPSRFNLDLLANCSEYPLFGDFCSFLANHGLGQKTHNLSHSWYRTDPLMLELIFHRRILEYPCLTSDPLSADAIFLPYYTALDSLKYLYGPEVNSSSDHGVNLYVFLQQNEPEIWKRHVGHDHFLVMARPAWDLSQPLYNDPPIWGTSFLELPEFFNITALTFESRAFPWQEQAIPYPTSFHPPTLSYFDLWMNRARRSKRTSLMLFAGGGGVSASPNIRRSIRDECENASNSSGNFNKNGEIAGRFLKLCEIVDCSDGKCEHDPVRYMRPMLKSSFCLQPPGDTPTRRATFDGILAGCIPVFFEELSAKSQYKWHLPEEKFEEFAVTIAKEDVVFNGLKIVDVLMGIPRARVRRMREKVLELIPKVVYRKHGSSLSLRKKKDAFDIAVEGVLQKVESRVKDFNL